MRNPMIDVSEKKLDSMAGVGFTTQNVAFITMFYLAFVVLAAMISWQHAFVFQPWAVPLAFGALGVGLLASFHPKLANFLGPVYAILEGMVIGVISFHMESLYPNIVIQAVLCTFGIAAACGIIFAMGWRMPSRLKSMVAIATMGIAFIYIFDLIAIVFFGTTVPFLHENTLQGMMVSVIIIIVATLRLFMDYEMIEHAEQVGLSKEYECYYAFGLTLTLLWLYLEILRLMGKSRSRK